MKIALVDDEPKYLDKMTGLVHDFCTQHCCQMETVPFLSGEAFLEASRDGGFSAVFMDIYMDGMDGVAAALKMWGMDNKCVLVFLTSSMDFMPEKPAQRPQLPPEIPTNFRLKPSRYLSRTNKGRKPSFPDFFHYVFAISCYLLYKCQR